MLVLLVVVVLAVAAAAAEATPAATPVSWVTPESFRTIQSAKSTTWNAKKTTPGGTLGDFANFTWTQTVDHFDRENAATFEQRWVIDDSHWKPGGPAFIFLSGEAPMEFFLFQEEAAIQWAYDLGALYISLEHRFYGESLPGSKPYYSTENLKYLSSEQALADAASFIAGFPAKTGRDISNWIVFGCSYSGGLSSWLRLKYPQLVLGSVAPSGPVNATVDFPGYYGHFAAVAPETCVSAVKAASQKVSSLFATEAGRAQLSTTFKACSPLVAADKYYFLLSLTEAVGGSDQYENAPKWPLNHTCASLTNGSDFVANWAKLMDPGAGQCNNFNEESGMIAPMKDVNSQSRSWFWQKCLEFGYFKPTDDSIFWPGELTLPHQVGWCERVFGIKGMTPDTAWTNANYGGFDQHATNVMFTNGVFDPWHILSINKDNKWGVKAQMYDAGHCAPMKKHFPSDPPSVIETRDKVKSYLTALLQ